MEVEEWARTAGGASGLVVADLSKEAHIVSAFQVYMTDQHALLDGEWQYSEWAMDSACTITLFVCQYMCLLANKRESMLRVKGFQGSEVSTAEAHGVLHGWAVATHGERTEAQSGTISIDGHALDTLNSNLMSMNAPIWRDKMRLLLCNPAHGASALATYPVAAGQVEVVIPVRFNATVNHWYARIVVGRSAPIAEKVGRLYEQFYTDNGGVNSVEAAGGLSSQSARQAQCFESALRNLRERSLDACVLYNMDSGLRDEREYTQSIQGRASACAVDGIVDVSEPDSNDIVLCEGLNMRGYGCGVVDAPLGSISQPCEHVQSHAFVSMYAGLGLTASANVVGGVDSLKAAMLDSLKAAMSTDYSARYVREASTLELLELARQGREPGQWGNDAQRDRAPTRDDSCCEGSVRARDVTCALWGEENGDSVWCQGPDVFPASWTAGGGDFLADIPMKSDELWRWRLCTNQGSVLASLRSTWIECATDGGTLPSSIFRVLEMYDEGSKCLRDMRAKGYGRRSVLQICIMQWSFAATQSSKIFLGGRTLFPSFWKVPSRVQDMVFIEGEDLAACDGNIVSYGDLVAREDVTVRNVLQRWLLGGKDLTASAETRMHERRRAVTAAVRGVLYNAHRVHTAATLLGPPGCGKHWLLKVWAQKPWSFGGQRVVFDGSDCGSNVAEAMRHTGGDLGVDTTVVPNITNGVVRVLSRAHVTPGMRERTVTAGCSLSALSLIITDHMEGKSSLKEMGTQIADLGRTWCAGGIIFVAQDTVSCKRVLRSRARDGDRHLDERQLVLATSSNYLLCELIKLEGSIEVHEVGLKVLTGPSQRKIGPHGTPSGQGAVHDACKRSAIQVLGSAMHLPGLNERDLEESRRRVMRARTRGISEPEAEGTDSAQAMNRCCGTDIGEDSGAVAFDGIVRSSNSSMLGQYSPYGRQLMSIGEYGHTILDTVRLVSIDTQYSPRDVDCVLFRNTDDVCKTCMDMPTVTSLERFSDMGDGEVLVQRMERRYDAGSTVLETACPAVVSSDTDCVDEATERLRHELDGTITGLRSKISKLNRTSEKVCHEERGHIPWRGDCEVCQAMSGVFMNHSRKRVDGFVDRRPCHTFWGDTITFDTRSRQGNKYLFCMTDGCGFIMCLCLAAKSDLERAFSRWLKRMRADPDYNHHEGYSFCVKVHLDCAGEQAHANVSFQDMLNTHDPAPQCLYGDPQAPVTHALQENLVQRMEVTIKSLLRQTASPAVDWENVVPQARLLRIIVPHKRDEVEAGAKGDVVTPLERATCGRIDRAQQQSWYKRFVGFGTVALTKRPAKQSAVDGQRYKIGVVKGFVPHNPDLTVFFDPILGQGTTWTTKSFLVVHRPPHVTYEEFLGVMPRPPSKKSLPRLGDYDINKRLMVVKLRGEDMRVSTGVNVPTEPYRKVSARNLAKPQVIFVDGNNDEWAPNDEGVLENRGTLLGRLHADGQIPAPKPTTKAIHGLSPETMKLRLGELSKNPTACVDRKDEFYRMFDEGLFKGRVIQWNKGRESWSVVYDLQDEHSLTGDGTREEFDKEDMRVYVYVGVDRPTRLIIDEQVPPEGQERTKGPTQPTLQVPSPYESRAGEPEPRWFRERVEGMPTVVTAANDTFIQVCQELQKLGFLKGEDEYTWYYEYLGASFGHMANNDEEAEHVLGVEFFKPFGRGGRPVRNQTKLRAGFTFPAPRGERWETLLGRKAVEGSSAVHQHNRLIDELLEEGSRVARAYQAQTRSDLEDEPGWVTASRDQGMSSYGCAKARRVRESDSITMGEVCPTVFQRAMERAMAVEVRKTKKDWPDWDLSQYMVNGQVMPPDTIKEARTRVDWPRWKDAIEVEYGSIDDMGVFIHNITRSRAKSEHNVVNEPIQLKSMFKIKYKIDGTSIDKYKCRRLVAAHPYACKDIDFEDTWAPAPNTATTRVMHAFALLRAQKVKCWDICVAFLHSKLAEEQYLLVRYEPEHQSVNENGEEHFALLIRGLYGLPSSPALFYKTLTDFMFERLNTGGWSCRRSALDPCFFILRGPHGAEGHEVKAEERGGTASTTKLSVDSEGSTGTRADLDMGLCDEHTVFMCVHVDDCDAVGESERNLQELRDLMHSRFGVKDCDKREMLGVRREWSEDGKYLEFTMPGFIEHTVERFKDYVSLTVKRTVPFPQGEMLIRGLVSKSESKRVLDRGLRELCGCLLWLWRMAMPLLGPGVNQVCKMMSAPDERTWECAVWLLEFAYQHREKGVRFCREGNHVPHTFYDSGGAPDPNDMKSQHGHLVYVAGGPVLHTSKKHRHTPCAGTMGKEWQACGYAVKDTVYVRMLMQDAGMLPRLAPPSIVTGDNRLTVGFATEKKMTANMKHVREMYMLTREWEESGDLVAEWIGTLHNPSDLCSKPVTKQAIDSLGDTATGYCDTPYNPENRPRRQGVRSRRETVDWTKLGRLDSVLDS